VIKKLTLTPQKNKINIKRGENTTKIKGKVTQLFQNDAP
jgi:hypothetical protein